MIGAAESFYGVTDAFSTECFGNTVVYRKQSSRKRSREPQAVDRIFQRLIRPTAGAALLNREQFINLPAVDSSNFVRFLVLSSIRRSECRPHGPQFATVPIRWAGFVPALILPSFLWSGQDAGPTASRRPWQPTSARACEG